MPRIDPLQLLKCLGVLLTPSGGIRSNEEVQRLASLMMKFSKKLVSKCVYILILKNTEPHLLGLFMSAGGWTLVLTWLSDGISGKNWALVTELLELLLMCPVDVERLKSNSIPRLVKGLSKDESLGQVNILASRLVEQWLKIVKDETVSPEVTSTVVIVNQENIVLEEIPQDNVVAPGLVEEITLKVDDTIIDDSQVVVSPQQFYKVTVRDGKQVIAKVDSGVSDNSAIERTEQSSDNMTLSEDNLVTVNHVEAHTEITEEIIKTKKEVDLKSSNNNNKEKEKSRHDRSSSSSSKHRSSSSKSSSSSSSKSSSRDKHSNSSSSNRDKNKDKDRDRTKDRDKHKHRSNGSVKHSSSSSSSNSSSSTNKDNKEKQAERDKDTLAKIQPKSVDKLGRIPKKSSSSSSSSDKKSDKKSSDSEHKSKPSISIEVRKKDGGDRPKTVKVFNSKLRSTGLEEAPKPPPPRATPKKPTTLPSIPPVKRPSPSREAPPPPEKRIKLPDTDTTSIEKPGGIKLIPPKPKPAFLQESNMFMDALASSATNKKEPKKRKRRTSVSKDAPTTPTTSSPPSSPSVATPSPLNSPLALKNIAAPKFYKETLDTEEPKPAEEETTTTIEPQPKESKPKETEDTANEIKSPDQVEEDDGPTENVVKEVNGVRGVLVYHKRKGPKKSVKWRQESELEEIQYFELDETERVNVTKTFMDMKQMEHVGEREALQLSRKLPNEDLMDERITWKALVPLDLPAALAEPGKKSLEKDIQFAREKVILQALYFNRSMLPDSAAEPDPETHQMTDPVIIPLDDVTGNPDSINDFQGTPWPEPKGSPPHPGPMAGPPSLFTSIPPFTPPVGPPGGGGVGVGPGFPNIPPQNFNGPNFMPPPHLMGAGDWRPMGEGPMPTDNNHPGPIAPLFNNRQDNFNDSPPVGFPPQGFGPPGPMGPPGPGPGPGPMFPPNFANNRGGNRGGFRNMGRGGWFRPAGPPPVWHGNRGGGGNHWGGRGGGGGICKQFKMHGYCRQRDTCPYMHPQGNAHNGPY